MKKLGLLILVGMTMQVAKAQYVNVDPDDLQAMMRQTLIVEHPDSSERIRPEVVAWPQEDLGKILKEAVDELWNINQKVEYESQNDVQRGLDRGNARNVYLFLTRHPEATVENDIWILNYSRGNTAKEGKIDYQLYLPEIKNREIKKWTEADIRFSLNLMQDHIKEIQKKDKKIELAEFLEAQAVKNCWKSEERHVLLDKGAIDKSLDARAMRKAFRRVNHTLMTTKSIHQALEENKDTCAFIIQYPGKFETYSNSAYGKKYIFWYKILVDANNYQVIGFTGDGRNDNVLKPIEGTDIKNLLDCNTRKPKPTPKKKEEKKPADRRKRR